MSGVLIIPQLPMVAQISGPGTGASNLLTPSPREVWLPDANALNHYFEVDLGSVRTFDSIHLGIEASVVPAISAIRTGPSANNGVPLGDLVPVVNPSGTAKSMIARFAPAATRYVYFTVTVPGPAPRQLSVKSVTIGKAFVHPTAYGSGRQLIDTSRRVDLIDGGFGVDAGISKAGFRWRLIDLDDDQVDALWGLAHQQGQRRPIVVVEDGDAPATSESAVHYGLFDKFEAFERANAADTQWALSMTEWR